MSITPANFSYLREIVQKHTGIIIDADKDYLVDGRLGPLLTGDGAATVDDLVHSLVSRPFSSTHEQVVEAMTNNET
jgi:chemotaxis protein methyltransferase CheR